MMRIAPRRGRVASAVFAFLSLLLAFATPPATAGVEIDPGVVLPVTIEKTWYRTDKVRIMGKAYEQSGTLRVNESGIEFTSSKGAVSIPGASIKSIEVGRMPPDLQNDWVIVHHGHDAEAGVAAFKGALFSGPDKDSLILSALVKLLEPAAAENEKEVP
jgi:hypothetical protein